MGNGVSNNVKQLTNVTEKVTEHNNAITAQGILFDTATHFRSKNNQGNSYFIF